MPAHVVILGGGVGGTVAANRLVRRARDRARVTVVDAAGIHMYQPGFLYVPFTGDGRRTLGRPERRLLDPRVDLVVDRAAAIDLERREIRLQEGATLRYDALVIATGSRLAPEEVPGLEEGAHHFYTLDAAERLHAALEQFSGGRIVVGVAGLPYKCPPAPLEFTFLLDDYLRRRGLRDRTVIQYLSPLPRVFPIEPVALLVGPLLRARGIDVVTMFNVDSVDPRARTVSSLEGETLSYDLLVLIPPHRGGEVVRACGLGDPEGWVMTDRETLAALRVPWVYAIGDATDLPVSKSGSAAHFEAHVVADNLASELAGAPAARLYDGRVTCFLETGRGQASLLLFNYTHAPRPRRPSVLYHLAKAALGSLYWIAVPTGLV